MLLDVTRLVQRALKGMLPTGVDRVGSAYVQHYADCAAALVRVAGRWVVLGPRDSRRLFDALIHPGPGAARRLLWSVAHGIVSQSGHRNHQVLINACHSGLEHPRYAREVHARRLQAVYFLHDLIPINHPQFCRAGEDRRHRLRLNTMFNSGRALIVNSQATREAASDYASAHGLRLPECVVAPLAPVALPLASCHTPLANNYFVILGTIEPRKNHALLLRVWRRLVAKLGDRAPRLVVIGRRGWMCEPVIDMLERCPMLRSHVLQQPRCSDRQLSIWLQHARALLFPSFAEGYGLPLVEALAQGVPVVASDLAAFREIAGEIPEYLAPVDSSGWQRAILDFNEPDHIRRRLQLQRMRNYSAPSWGEHFALVDTLVDRWSRRRGPVSTRAGWVYVRGR
jgi:glycosyltransferase involved in cell wall biosynthesis